MQNINNPGGMVMEDLGKTTTKKVLRRISLFLGLILFANTIDRVNVSFASLHMNGEIGLGPEQYGFGVGLFFVSYMVFQIPAVALAERIGLVRAIGGMAVAWGLVSASMCLIDDPASFYILRFLLGIAEAGVSPAILLYSSRWCPPEIAARFVSATALALPASFVLGAPVSGWLMTSFDGFHGLAGWQWMYLIEGIIPIGLGILTFFWLSERPRDARWLTTAQQTWLDSTAGETTQSGKCESWSQRLFATVCDRRVWMLGLTMFCTSMGFYGFLFWLPQVVSMLAPGSKTAFVLVASAVPWVSAALGMILVGKHSDRQQERHLHVAGSATLAAAGLMVAAATPHPVIGFLALTVAGFGVGAAQGIFYSIPLTVLRGTPQLGMALAVISLLANAAGLVGGNVIGLLREATGSFVAAIAMLAATYMVGAGVLLIQRPKRASFRGATDIAI